MPAGMTIDASGLIQWAPNPSQFGPSQVKLRVDVFVDGQLFLPKQQTLVLPPRKVTPADEKNDKPEEDRPGEKGIDLVDR